MNEFVIVLLTQIASVQVKHVLASFLFVGDLNGHHRNGWILQPRIVMMWQPLASRLSGCDQLVVDPTHARGGTLYLLITDIPCLLRVGLML